MKVQVDMVRQEAGMGTEFCLTRTSYMIWKRRDRRRLWMPAYRQYETSNYVKRGMECRHNIGYWTRADYLGLGIGAALLISNVRYTNTSDMDEYLSCRCHIHDVGDDIFKANLHVQLML